jgi:hypothetical protein
LACLHLLLELSVSPQSVEHDVVPAIDTNVEQSIAKRVPMKHFKSLETDNYSEVSEDDAESLQETLVEDESSEVNEIARNLSIDRGFEQPTKYWRPQKLPPALGNFQ